MNLINVLKNIEQPFNYKKGFYAITAILFTDTFINFSGSNIVEDGNIHLPTLTLLLLLYFVVLHILPQPLRISVHILKLFLLGLIDWIFKTDVSEFKWESFFGNEKSPKNLHNKDDIEKLSILSKNTIIHQLIVVSDNKEIKYKQLQNVIFTLICIVPFNYYHNGVINTIVNYFENKDKIIVFGIILLVIGFLFSTRIKEYRIHLEHEIFEKIANDSGYKSKHSLHIHEY